MKLLSRIRDHRISDIILTAAAALIVFGTAAAMPLIPDRGFSEAENRVLSGFPEFSLRAVAGGGFMDKMSVYIADQFPAREAVVGAKAALELAALRHENNGVIVGSGGYLIDRLEYSSDAALLKNTEAVRSFSEDMRERGIGVIFAVAPRGVDVLGRYFPPLYSGERTARVWEKLADAAQDAPYTYLPLCEQLRAHAEAGEYVYYRTDHHWTAAGAYVAYREICAALGVTPQPEEAFTAQTASESFIGTTASAFGGAVMKPDTIEFRRYEGDDDYTVRVTDDGSEHAGFYAPDYLSGKDKYGAYLYGNNAHMTVTKNNPGVSESRERLLVVKDSFAHSVIPYLACHFDLEVVDPRYYKQSVTELAVAGGISRVLILAGADSLESAPAFTLLGAG